MIGIIWFVNDNKDKRVYSVILSLYSKDQKRAGGGIRTVDWRIDFLERESLLSKIPTNPIVGILQSKKESCSTQRGLRVGSDLREFRQTP